MSEESWGSDHNEPARARGGIPRWVWFCGGGCLLLLLLGAGALFVGWRMVSGMMDPEEQWARLAKVLPYDERPDAQIGGVKVPFQPLHTWWLFDQASGLQAVVFHATGSLALEVRSDLLEGGGEYGSVPRGQLQSGEVEVQGRPLPVVRWTGAEEEPQEQPAAGGEPDKKPGLFESIGEVMQASSQAANAVVDLTRPGASDALLLMLTRMPVPGARGVHRETITDDEIRAFLEPFQVGERR